MDCFQHLSSFSVIPNDYIAHSGQDIYTAKQQRFVLSNAEKNPLGCIDLYDFDPQHHRVQV